MDVAQAGLLFGSGLAIGVAGAAFGVGRYIAVRSARALRVAQVAQDAVTAERDEARARVDALDRDLAELVAHYTELREAHESALKQLEAARLHNLGLEGELGVQERSARLARDELEAARRRIFQLEGDRRDRRVG